LLAEVWTGFVGSFGSVVVELGFGFGFGGMDGLDGLGGLGGLDGKLGYWAATNANRRNFIINKIK